MPNRRDVFLVSQEVEGGVCYTASLQSTSTKCCLLSLINNETDVTPDTTGELSLLLVPL